MVLEHLEPQPVWQIFESIFTTTYRTSGEEQSIRDKIVAWVKENTAHNLTAKIDRAGNILIKKTPSLGCEHYPPLLFQGHMDMVCETDRPGGFDFQHQPLPIRVSADGEWVSSDGTTLGADDGIGLSLILALFLEPDEKFPHGPLELLITVQEETGLNGAFGLDCIELGIQSRYLINIDSEELGFITIGSAGGQDVHILINKLTTQRFSPEDIYHLRVSGLKGGHSGVDIHHPLGNAHKIAARIMYRLLLDGIDVFLLRWTGGSKRNAIPRESEVEFWILSPDRPQIERIFAEERESLLQYYRMLGEDGQSIEPTIQIELTSIQKNTESSFLSSDLTATIIRMIHAFPHGVQSMSAAIPTLVETSGNLAILNITPEIGIIDCMLRSSSETEQITYANRIRALVELAGFRFTPEPAYPGWMPDLGQPLLKYVTQYYQKAMKEPIRLGAIHAGLECGIIQQKIPGLQAVAIGPTVHYAHTPKEQVNVSSVQILYELIKNLIQNANFLL
jgi:dipeptidase D